MKIVDSQIITMFVSTSTGQAVVWKANAAKDEKGNMVGAYVPARDALKDAYAHGWQPHQFEILRLGVEQDTNNPQIEMIWHLVKYEDELVPAKSKLKNA